MTSTTTSTTSYQHQHHDTILLRSIQHQASLWVHRHEQKRRLLLELLHHQQVFGNNVPSKRRELMREIRKISTARIHIHDYMVHVVLTELVRMVAAFAALPSLRRSLMKEIRVCGHERATMIARFTEDIRALLHERLMEELVEHASSRNLLRDMMRQLLMEVREQGHAFGYIAVASLHDKLTSKMLLRIKERSEIKRLHAVVMKELMREVPKLKRRRLMDEVHHYESSRHLVQDMKRRMLLELREQHDAFRPFTMRRKLMAQIREQTAQPQLSIRTKREKAVRDLKVYLLINKISMARKSKTNHSSRTK